MGGGEMWWFSLIWAGSHWKNWWWMWRGIRRWEPPGVIRRAKPLIAVCHEVHKTQKEFSCLTFPAWFADSPIRFPFGLVTCIEKAIIRRWPQDITHSLQLGKNNSYFSPKKVLPLGSDFCNPPPKFVCNFPERWNPQFEKLWFMLLSAVAINYE